VSVVLAFVADVLARVFVEPVREGRLRATGWPTGLRAVTALALAAYVAAAGLLLSAPWARRHSLLGSGLGGEVSYPRWSLSVFLALTALTLALLHAASLHLPPWLRVGALLVVGLALVELPVTPLDAGRAPHVVSWVGAGLLAVLTVVRWRSRFGWWEFVASFLVIGVTMAVASRLVARLEAPVGLDAGPTALTRTMGLVAVLAVPFTFVAGLAFAQLALLLAHRASEVVDDRVGRTWPIAVVVAIVAVADLVLLARRLRVPTATGAGRLAEAGSGLLLLLIALGVGYLLQRGSVPDRVELLDGAVSRLALPVGLLVTITQVPLVLVTRLHTTLVLWSGDDPLRLDDVRDALGDADLLAWSRIAAGAGLVGWAFWQRRGQALSAVLAATIGIVVLSAEVSPATHGAVSLPWTPDAVNDAAVVVSSAALLVLAALRRLDRARLVALGAVLGIALAWSARSTFDAPFVAVFGLGATAAVFLGVLWTTLTDAAEANDDSTAYPRPARVLLFLGNAVLTMTALAFLALTRAGHVGIDLSAFGTLGDLLLGTGLLLAAYAVLTVPMLRGVRTGPRPRC